MLVLIGAPGAGKSTVGRRLANRLSLPFVDVDQLIEQTSGREIADIFATDGEATFRELERAATVAALAGSEEQVVSLGGGAPMTEAIAEALAPHHVVWLKVSPGAAADRVGLNVARPLLLGNVRSRLVSLLNARTPTYQRLADHVVETDDHGADDIVELIIEHRRELERR
ncbi:shikimate kinase [Naumannella halotolerans]|nr:shikimate kinase [Naumannella halotolerans]